MTGDLKKYIFFTVDVCGAVILLPNGLKKFILLYGDSIKEYIWTLNISNSVSAMKQ